MHELISILSLARGEALRLESSSNVLNELVVPWYHHVAATGSDNTWLGRLPESVSADLPVPFLQADTEDFETVVQIASSWRVQLWLNQYQEQMKQIGLRLTVSLLWSHQSTRGRGK
jgi:hypothetical protein